MFSDRKPNLIERANEMGIAYHADGPTPTFLSYPWFDSGLLTLSRYPIAKSKYFEFQYPLVYADIAARKGVLYTKIDLSSVGGSFLHLFNMHTQATYDELGNRMYVETFVSRYMQIKEARQFI